MRFDKYDSKNQINERKQLEILTLEQLVPANNLVRKLDTAIDFHLFIHSPFGRPSIDPIVLKKTVNKHYF